MSVRIAVLQACLPDYRREFFSLLLEAVSGVRLYCGKSYFTSSLKLETQERSGVCFLQNRLLLGGRFMWQSGSFREILASDLLIAEFNPRIISVWLLLLSRWILGRKTILWGHIAGKSSYQYWGRCGRRLMLALTDGAICYTAAQAAALARHYSRPIWAAPNSCFKHNDVHPCPRPRGEDIVYVGRLIASKKVSLLIEAFAKALHDLPLETKLIIVGDGEQRDPLLRQIKEQKLESRVVLTGHISSVKSLAEIYNRALVSVSPGYAGLSVIQSMAYGVPVLISRDEPHSPEIEACIAGHNCEFFLTDRSDDLAQQLITIFLRKTDWASRRTSISEHIITNYSFEGMVATFVKAIEHYVTLRQAERAIVWAQFGPYHLARLRALEQSSVWKTVGVEIAGSTATYAWENGGREGLWIETLLPREAAENVSGREVFRLACAFFSKTQPKLIFVPSYWPATSLAVLLAAKASGARAVMMNDSHAGTAKARGPLALIKRRLVLSFDAALVAGSAQVDYFKSLGFPEDRIVTGYDVVDNDYFEGVSTASRLSADAVRKRLGLPHRYFLNIGRQVKKKNLLLLIDAYAMLLKRCKESCPSLVFVGGGPCQAELIERCQQLSMSVFLAGSSADLATAKVVFFGFQQISDLPHFYAHASAFVLPSSEEEWGLVVNEAMACRLPVLVSDRAGCARDLVMDSQNGFTFSPDDPSELASRLELFVIDSSLTERMGNRSIEIIRKWSCQRFSTAVDKVSEIALGRARKDML